MAAIEAAGQEGRPAAQGDLLAEGGRLIGQFIDARAHRALRRDPDHLHGRAGHHQQRAGDGDARARARDRHAARDRRPAALHPGDAGDRGARRRPRVRRPGRRRWARCWSAIVGKVGIPAKSDVWFFFFSGPRLHPFLGTSNVVAALHHRAAVSAFSSFYPAWLAMRVTPAPGHAGGGMSHVQARRRFHDRLPQPGRSTAGARCSSAPPSPPSRRCSCCCTGLSTGVRETMIDTATTLSTGHVNVGGFFKVTAGQAAPVVTDYEKVLERRAKARARDGVRGPARPRLGQGRLRHRLDAARHRRHRHQQPSRSSRRCCRS